MIIWRGWGFLTVVYVALGAALLGGFVGASLLGSSSAAGVLAGVGIMIGGLLGALHGWYLNTLAPRRRAEEWALAETLRLEAAARNGTLAIDNVRLTSVDDALDQVDVLVERRKAAIARGGRNTVFFVPMEIVGILAIVGGLVLTVAMLVTGASS